MNTPIGTVRVSLNNFDPEKLTPLGLMVIVVSFQNQTQAIAATVPVAVVAIGTLTPGKP